MTPFEEDWKIVVLPAEAQAIAELVGREPASFIDETPLVPDQHEHYLDNEPTDPLWSTLFARWPRPTGFKGKCPFLGANGCSLPYTHKPFLCQAYPLEFNLTESSLSLPPDEERAECDITVTARSPGDVTACFGDDLEALRQRLGVFRQRALDLLEELAAKQERSSSTG